MSYSETTGSVFNTGMIKVGAAVTGGGLLVAAMGTGLVAIAVMRGAMAWTRQREISPGALAAARFGQARHASVAGVRAWREHAGAMADGQGVRA
jgi:hypothetical protein